MEDRQFNTDDRVVVRNINRLINGCQGSIVGWSLDDAVANMYIVLLDFGVVGAGGFIHKAVNIPEGCLEKV